MSGTRGVDGWSAGGMHAVCLPPLAFCHVWLNPKRYYTIFTILDPFFSWYADGILSSKAEGNTQVNLFSTLISKAIIFTHDHHPLFWITVRVYLFPKERKKYGKSFLLFFVLQEDVTSIINGLLIPPAFSSVPSISDVRVEAKRTSKTRLCDTNTIVCAYIYNTCTQTLSLHFRLTLCYLAYHHECILLISLRLSGIFEQVLCISKVVIFIFAFPIRIEQRYDINNQVVGKRFSHCWTSWVSRSTRIILTHFAYLRTEFEKGT